MNAWFNQGEMNIQTKGGDLNSCNLSLPRTDSTDFLPKTKKREIWFQLFIVFQGPIRFVLVNWIDKSSGKLWLHLVPYFVTLTTWTLPCLQPPGEGSNWMLYSHDLNISVLWKSFKINSNQIGEGSNWGSANDQSNKTPSPNSKNPSPILMLIHVLSAIRFSHKKFILSI